MQHSYFSNCQIYNAGRQAGASGAAKPVRSAAIWAESGAPAERAAWAECRCDGVAVVMGFGELRRSARILGLFQLLRPQPSINAGLTACCSLTCCGLACLRFGLEACCLLAIKAPSPVVPLLTHLGLWKNLEFGLRA